MADDLPTIKMNWSEVALIVAAGAVGGLLSWAYAVATSQPLTISMWAFIPLSVVLGMGAAFVGVYVIANADTRALPRCMGLALLCGFGWKLVFDAGAALVSQHLALQTSAKASAAGEEAVKLAGELPNASDAALAAKINETARATTHLLAQLPKVQDLDLKPKLRSQAMEARTSLRAVATRNPGAAARGLAEIASAAAADPELQDFADSTASNILTIASESNLSPADITAIYTSLDNIAKTAQEKQHFGLAAQSRARGAEAILAAAKDAKPELLKTLPLKAAQDHLVRYQSLLDATHRPDDAKKAGDMVVKLQKLSDKANQ